MFQSSLAITGERALSSGAAEQSAYWFQSTLAITGERAAPRARNAGAVGGFQSTLAITGERARSKTGPRLTASCFNPRSPLLASEPKMLCLDQRGQDVSIHARHYWRASRTGSCYTGRIAWFQSSLAITGERACTARPRAAAYSLVSIHARHYWRASQGGLTRWADLETVSIHARHYWRASHRLRRPGALQTRVSIHARHYWRASR